MTSLAQLLLDGNDAMTCLKRHERGDWGDVGSRDAEANDYARDRRMRVLSSYRDRHGPKFWIVTAADRGETTILLPEEY